MHLHYHVNMGKKIPNNFKLFFFQRKNHNQTAPNKSLEQIHKCGSEPHLNSIATLPSVLAANANTDSDSTTTFRRAQMSAFPLLIYDRNGVKKATTWKAC